MNIKKILIIYKTHLDIGFTDFSENVIQRYKDVFIPNALTTAGELHEKNSSASFKWTTGSWLISEYLKTESEEKKQILCDAIRRGDICWHGLPFTTHTEIMSESLFEYGLSLSEKLDKQFGVKTIAAKMTDVPGHTKAMIPLLASHGIELLHIGVNPASSVPEVPEIFRWKADSGEEITVIYNSEYGTFTPLGDTGIALYFAHTNDNLGSQTSEEVEELFTHLREELPGAELVAADLNDVALVVREIKESLPVITDEFGDSWIHGTATDPCKISQFRSLLPIFESLPEGKDKEILGDGLLIIPEHTWGLDEKTHLHDNAHYSREEFAQYRKTENYLKMEASWREQRNFMYNAIEKLSESVKAKCNEAISQYRRNKTDISGMREIKSEEKVTLSDCAFAFNDNGAIFYLKAGDKVISDECHPLFNPMYEQFSYDDYLRLRAAYNRSEEDWAWEDFTKIGMGEASPEYVSCGTTGRIYADNDKIVVKFAFPDDFIRNMGAPAEAEALITVDDNKITYDFAWFDKPANRIAEAVWLSFKPIASDFEIRKLGRFISPRHVVSKGNRNLHATDYGMKYDDFTVRLIDSALISPGRPHLCDFVNIVPSQEEGAYFNLYNNIWGTNFPMWYEGDARYRFVIEF